MLDIENGYSPCAGIYLVFKKWGIMKRQLVANVCIPVIIVFIGALLIVQGKRTRYSERLDSMNTVSGLQEIGNPAPQPQPFLPIKANPTSS